MTATILTTNAAAQTRWANKVFSSYIDKNPLKYLTTPASGVIKSAIFQENFPPQSGDQVIYHFRNPLSISGVREGGDLRLQGSGADIARGTDSYRLVLKGLETPIRNNAESQQRTKHDLYNEAIDELGSAMARYHTSQVLAQLTDATTGRTQNRFRYGVAESNWNATHATAMANVDSTNDRLSLAMLDDVVVKMRTQSSTRGFMEPMVLGTKKGASQPKYVGLFHPRAIRDLKRDTDFRLFVTQKDAADFDVISGADYIGEYNGVLIYQMNPLDSETDRLLVTGAGASSIDVANNVILGAEAVAVGYGTMPKPIGSTKYSMEDGGRMLVTMVDDNHGRDTLMAAQMYTGFKKLVDNSGSAPEQRGVFNLFTSAAV
jgi:N4-gp56 family major capsid protein